jgi:hypothetical protein
LSCCFSQEEQANIKIVVSPREKREEWPLLTIETEVNVDSKVEMIRVGWFVGLVVPVQKNFCPALVALVGPVQNIIFLATHFFTLCLHRQAT